MAAHNVRKATVQYIASQLEGRPPIEPPADLKASTMSLPNFSTAHSESALGESVMSEAPPPSEPIPMDPLYIHSQRDLEEAFREMQPHFEGKETEHNWIPRDRSVMKIRRLMTGNAPTEFHVPFVMGIKSVADGISKVANSLRTTMSSNGCLCVQELAKTLGTSFDPIADFFVPGFVKMSGATKHIAATNGNTTVNIILANITYHHRRMEMVWSASQEKNVQIRSFATEWLRTLLQKHNQKSLESSLDMVEKCLKKGLVDPNPKVKEGTRSTYWVYARAWPAKAESFLENLEPRTKQYVEKDPSNPKASLASSQSSGGMAPGDRPLTAASGRASIRETIMAQRRAQQAAAKLERPTSAQSVLSPANPPPSLRSAKSTVNVRHASNLSTSSTKSQASSTTTAGSSSNGGGLMSAPLRRPRRPEPTRPATADPYARGNRGPKVANHTTPSMSPAGSPGKDSTIKKPSPAKSSHTPASRIPVSPPRSKSRVGQLAVSGRARATSLEPASPGSSPSKADDLTYVVPFTRPPTEGDESTSGLPYRNRAGMDKTMSVDSGIAGLTGAAAEDDGFTMVLPPNVQLNQPHTDSNGLSGMSPQKSGSPRASPRTTLNAAGSPGKSPLRMSRSPLPQRQLFPSDNEGSQKEEVHVFEDPFVADEPVGSRPNSPDKPVLEELPLSECNVERDSRLSSEGARSTSSNEQNRRIPSQSPTRSPTKTNGNTLEVTHDRAETLRSRRLLSSGIERVRARTLDAHGFRRLQDLVRQGNPDIWYVEASPANSSSDVSTPPPRQGNKFADLLQALLNYLSTPLDPAKFPASKAQNLKTQALATLRAMLALWKKESERFAPAVLCDVIIARGEWDGSSHLGSELERTSEEVATLVAKIGRLSEGIEGMLHVVEGQTQAEGEKNSRVVTAGLGSLGFLLALCGRTNAALNALQARRLGVVAVKFLADQDPDVRRADMEFCLELHERLGGAREGGNEADGESGGFWKAMGMAGLRPEHVNLITYYLARRGRA